MVRERVIMDIVDKRWLENYNSFKEYVTKNANMPSLDTSSSLGVNLGGECDD